MAEGSMGNGAPNGKARKLRPGGYDRRRLLRELSQVGGTANEAVQDVLMAKGPRLNELNVSDLPSAVLAECVTAGKRARTEPKVPGLIRASEIKVRKVRWLWEGRVPFAKITVAEGDPDVGKSTATVDITARATTGAPMGGEGGTGRKPVNVLMVCAEDDVEDTIVPRLMAADADLPRVFFRTVERDDDGNVIPLTVPDDVEVLRGEVERGNVGLVVIDPIAAVLSEKVNSHNDASLRRALMPLKEMAQDTGCAVLLVRHLNKGSGENMPAIYRGNGSIGMSALARSGLVFARHPQEPDTFVMAQVKNNLAGRYPSVSYHIATKRVADDVTSTRIVWTGQQVDMTADTLLGSGGKKAAPRREEAKNAIAVLLGDGPMLATEVEAQRVAAGIGRDTWNKAKDELGVESKPLRSADGKRIEGWWWCMPGQEPAQPPDQGRVRN